MAWTDYAKWAVPGYAGYRLGKELVGATDRTNNEFRDIDPEGKLAGQADAAGQFATQGEQGYAQAGQRMGQLGDMLMRQAQGQDSLSAEQLRQGLQSNVAAQRSMAASASPSNAAMAARTAATQGARLGAGLSGQQAMAGIAERQAAAQSLGNVLTAQRGQDLQAALNSRGNALQGYGALESARTGRWGTMAQMPTGFERLLGMGQAGMQMYAMSDRELKTDIDDADEDAGEFLRSLRPYKFKYSDPKYGDGEQLGIMAQDLERSRHGRQAVVQTREGKAVHGAKLATALAAAAAHLDKRVSKLEGKQ